MNARRIAVVTTTRADYGLLYWLLRDIDRDPELELMLMVTGTHLSTEFGMTVKEIDRDGFRIHRHFEILLSSDSRTAMTKAMGLALLSLGDALAEDRPDVLVLLGDRFEIVPLALAAVIHGIPVAHLHGGEITRGALDDGFRHAVTKLSNIHFPATEPYRQRILQMGEDPSLVFNVGAPGLDHLQRTDLFTREALAAALGMSLDRPTAIVTYHPVTRESDASAEQQITALLHALETFDNLQIVFTKANADTQGRTINARLAVWCEEHAERSRLYDNMGQRLYLSCLCHLDVMVGNSSSGLVEAPSLQLPVVNVGNRQEGRLAACNVISVGYGKDVIQKGIARALSPEFRDGLIGMVNPYDRFKDGSVSRRIKETLKTVSLDADSMKKRFHDLATISQELVTPEGEIG